MEDALRKPAGEVEEEKRVESNGKMVICLQGDRLESTKAKMVEVSQENQRLKTHLSRIMKDYHSLQMQLHDFIVKQEAQESTNASAHHYNYKQFAESHGHHSTSLSLGRTSTSAREVENPREGKEDQQLERGEGLALGLHNTCFEVSKTGPTHDNSPKPVTPKNNLEVNKEAVESSRRDEVLKTMRSLENEVSQQNSVKKARVSVRIRCDTPTMNDGCQWRKYGQKIAKGNPCPRAYYRCTLAPTCPVRKQVQRCADDMSILISTYEGTHNHPLPISAATMASTTSAAASMLLSGSSASGTGSNSSVGTTTSSTEYGGMKFYNSNLYYPCNSSIFSSSPSYPPITLDLTSTSDHFYKISSNTLSASRYPSTSLNFTSSESIPQLSSCSDHDNRMPKYGIQVPYSKYRGDHSLGFPFYPSPPQQNLTPDAIAAATKVITSDPSFQYALAAALTSIVGSSGGVGGGGGGGN